MNNYKSIFHKNELRRIEDTPGLENGLEKNLDFLGLKKTFKNLKSPKFRFFRVFFIFWSNFMQTMISNFIF